jgi:hypothetical protein
VKRFGKSGFLHIAKKKITRTVLSLPTMVKAGKMISFAFSAIFFPLVSGHAQSQPKLKLLTSKHLPRFPSCSAVNYHSGRLYLVGDDARCIYILDRHYNVIDSARLFDFPEKRISKEKKEDLEASTFILHNNASYLLTLGSAATTLREVVKLIPYTNGLRIDSVKTISTASFLSGIKSTLKQVNLEGIAQVGDKFVLSNRANMSDPINYFIVSSGPFWSDQENVVVSIVEVELPLQSKNTIGVSDLCYDELADRLFVSFSTELNGSAYGDGDIEDSYIGCIRNFSKILNSKRIKVDEMINLSNIAPVFKKQKIEGLCIERVRKNRYIFHLASDDDKGSSMLFKILAKW